MTTLPDPTHPPESCLACVLPGQKKNLTVLFDLHTDPHEVGTILSLF